MVGARKGPHRSLGFAFGAGSKQNGAPDASDITVRGNRTPTLRPSLAIGFRSHISKPAITCETARALRTASRTRTARARTSRIPGGPGFPRVSL